MKHADEQCVITIDVGTSSLRSSLYTVEGHLKFSSKYSYSPQFQGSDEVEQNPDIWIHATLSTLREVSNFCNTIPSEIIAISITSQRASVIPVDIYGNPIHNAIMWQDKRSYQECERFSKEISAETVYDRTGLRIDSYFSAPKIMWFKTHEPEIFSKTYKLLGVQDFIVMKLTGEYITDVSQASRTLLMDIRKKCWDLELLSCTGIDTSLLPDICESSSICGGLNHQFAGQVGLPRGLPVVIAGGDQPCAAMSLGMLKQGRLIANTGTGSFLLGYSDKPKFDPERRTLCSMATSPGAYVVETGVLTSGILIQWAVERWYKHHDSGVSYDRIFEDILKAPVGSNGVVCLPHFKGVAAPYWNPSARGMFYNLSLSTTLADMSRSILEGISLEMADNLDLMKAVIGSIDSIAIAGGMTKREVFNQMQADVFAQEVMLTNSVEATSLGAWMSAVVAMGLYDNHVHAQAQIAPEKPRIYYPNLESIKTYSRIQKYRKFLYKILDEGNVFTRVSVD